MNRNENEAESFAGNFMAFGEEALFFEVPSCPWAINPIRQNIARVLRASRERPRGCAAEQRDELASS